MSIVAFTHYRQAQSGDVLEDLVARGFPRNEPPRFRQPSCPKLFLDLFCGKNNPLCNAVLAMGGRLRLAVGRAPLLHGARSRLA